MDLPHDAANIPQKTTEYISAHSVSDELFADRKNRDMYWEALVQAAKNNREGAQKIVAALRSESYPIISPAWKESKPQNIDDFYDKLFLTTVSCDPMTLTYLGLFESVGIREHNAFLTDLSPKAMRRDLKNLKESLQTLRQYSVDDLSSEQAISFKIFSWKLEHAAQGEEFLFHDYLIHQMHGAVQNVTATLLLMHKLEVPEDVDHYIARLSRIPEYFRQAVETVEHQKQQGIVPPRFAVEKVIKMINKFVDMPPEENVFYTYLAAEAAQIEGVQLQLQLSKAKAVMREKVYPAYQMVKGYLAKLQETAKENYGVWALPNGDEYYTHVLQHHTTTNLTAAEIHELGLKEVARIQNEMRTILACEGIVDPNREVGELVAEVTKGDAFYYPNTDAGRKECLAQFEAILERCREKLWPLFDIKPKSMVVLKAVPKHEEEGSAAAYYYPSSIDGSRPGAFYVNLRNMRELPKNRMETLAIHEAEPGHHFQCSIENEMNIPALRKVGHFTAYTEGWALYTEKLAYEEGFYSTAFDKLGHLQDELLRAVRLVVDTGIHMKRWTREQAIDYMAKMTGDHGGHTVTEIERYFVCPGQACAYKIGQLKILELRQKAKDQLGDKFDIRDFHNVVLKVGSVPLVVLEDAIEEYIQSKLSTGNVFANKPASDLYWEALVQVAHNDKEGASQTVQAIRSKNFAAAVSAWRESLPKNIDAFFDKLFVTSVWNSPYALTQMGLLDSIGIKEHNAYLNDVSIKAILADYEMTKDNLRTLRQYDVGQLSSEQQMSYKIALWKLSHEVEGEPFLLHSYSINQRHGVIHNLVSLMTTLHKLEASEDIDNYLSRLQSIPVYFNQAIETMEYRRQHGILPPRFAIEKAVTVIQKLIQPPVSENVLYKYLAKHVPSDNRLAQAKAVIEEKVYPAYRKLQEYLVKVLETATTNHGVWALPNGDDYYAYMLKWHTTTEMTADEIHDLGLQEVSRIQHEMRELFALEGIVRPEKEVGELIQELSKDERFYYPNTDEGRQACLTQIESILDRCRKELWPLFDMKPSAKAVVKRVPQHEEATGAVAYYMRPSLDGSRPGAFYVNLRDMHEIPKYHMETIAIHEAEPGHHFQRSIQSEADLPILRKMDSFTAYGEGWGLYAEKLAYEQDFYSTPFDKLGHLQYELLRAARLVVDTGIHKKRWSHDQAVAYMEKITGHTHDSVVTEVERYFVMPGQACAYKIGQLKLLELRKKAKDQLGDKFDIRDFHNVVLKVGPVPLMVLEEAVDAYVQSKLVI